MNRLLLLLVAAGGLMAQTPYNITYNGASSTLNDAFISGTYSTTLPSPNYCVKIDGTGSPNTFSWGTGTSCTSGATGVSINSTISQTLSNGISVKFAGNTGHTLAAAWVATYSNIIPSGPGIGGSGGGGSGTVTSVATSGPITGGTFTTSGTIACPTCVTSASALSSTAVMTGAGSQGSQTPSATTTLDTSGNLSTQGSVSTGVGSGAAGFVSLVNGTAPTLTANAFTWFSPATISTGFGWVPPSSAQTGFVLGTASGTTVTLTQVASTGTGSVVLGTSPAITTDLHCASAGGCTIGTAALPVSGVFIGGAATNNVSVTGTFTAARTATIPDLTGTFVVAGTSTTATQAMFATATAGAPAFRSIQATDIPLGSVNAQTATYTGVSGDSGKWVTMNCSSCTFNVPASPPNASWNVNVQSINASALTISRNGALINTGTANLSLNQYDAVNIYTDGTNYFTRPPVSATAPITITYSTSAIAIACPNCAVVNAGNTFTTGAQDFGGVTSLKIPVGAGATAATNGLLAYDSTNNMLHAAQTGADAKVPQFTITPANGDCVNWVVSGSNYKLGTAGAACGSGGGGGSPGSTLFSQISSVTATAASPTSLVGTVSGSTTIAANTFTVGQFLQIQAEGFYTSPATLAGLTIDLKIGGTTRISTGSVGVQASVTNGVWRFVCGVTTRTIGGTGTQIANCVFELTGTAATPSVIPLQVSAVWTIDTTATNAIDIQATWSTTTGAPSITSTNIAAWIPGAPVTSVNTMTGAISLPDLNSSGQVVALHSPTMGTSGTANSISITATAGTGGVTANLLAARDTSNPIKYVLPSSGGCGAGFAASSVSASATFELYVVPGLVVTGVADNAVTSGDILIGGTTTPGRVRDSATTDPTTISATTCIVGVALASATTGSSVLLRYFGPSAYGALSTGLPSGANNKLVGYDTASVGASTVPVIMSAGVAAYLGSGSYVQAYLPEGTGVVGSGDNDVFTCPNGNTPATRCYINQLWHQNAAGIACTMKVFVGGSYRNISLANNPTAGGASQRVHFVLEGGEKLGVNCGATASESVEAGVMQFNVNTGLNSCSIPSRNSGNCSAATAFSGSTTVDTLYTAANHASLTGLSSLNGGNLFYWQSTGGSRTLNLYLVPNGATCTNTTNCAGNLIATQTFTNTTFNTINVVGFVLNPGDSIRVNSDSSNASQFLWATFIDQ